MTSGKGSPHRIAFAASAIQVAMGALLVVLGWWALNRFTLCIGITFILFGASAVLLRRLRPSRQWLALVPVVCGIALLAGAGLSRQIDAHVTSVQLISHPLAYNHRMVHTTGEIVAGNGICELIIPGRTLSPAIRRIWLASRNVHCNDRTTRRWQANISGTFTARNHTGQSLKGFLTGAVITPVQAP
ncbi:MAG TPA: hypothetical protein VF271_05460 [Rhodanobacteraceae bacterium]